MTQKKFFITTKDLETAERLRALGYMEIPQDDTNTFVFANNPTIKFNQEEFSKATITNMIHL